MALAGLFSRKTPEQMLRQNQRALNKVSGLYIILHVPQYSKLTCTNTVLNLR